MTPNKNAPGGGKGLSLMGRVHKRDRLLRHSKKPELPGGTVSLREARLLALSCLDRLMTPAAIWKLADLSPG